MVRDFYASYASTIQNTLPKGKKHLSQPRLTETRVRGRRVDISETTIRSMLFGPEFPASRSTTEFYHKVGQMRDLTVIRDPDHRVGLIRWVAELIAEQGPEPAWVATHSEPIVKAYLIFPSNVWWSVIRSHIRATLVDNTLMPNHIVLVANIFAGYEIN